MTLDRQGMTHAAAGIPTGGQYQAKQRRESDVNLVYRVAPEAEEAVREFDPETNRLTRYTEFDADGRLVVELRYDSADETGEPILTMARRFVKHQSTNFENGSPATQVFYPTGEPHMLMRQVNGRLCDGADGEPAIRVLDVSGREQLRAHYQNGTPQDPEPGKPARVATMEDGSVLEQFFTDGQQTKQVDHIRIDLPGQPGMTKRTADDDGSRTHIVYDDH